jgi:hypothetical protein
MFISSVLLIKKYLDTSDTLFIIYTIIIIYFVSFIIIIICAICGKKYVFSKDIQKNKFYIKRFNFFNKLILDLELSLGNYYIKCEELISQTSDGCSYTYYIIKVYNQINDTSEINLDITNIKEVPIKFIYIFYISLSGFNSVNQLENKLNNFICTKNLNAPFSFDINAI